MALARLRRSARSLSIWLLLVSIGGLPHRVDGADTCPPTGQEEHDESKHVFSASSPGDHGEHCAVCHWLRSIKLDQAERSAAGRTPDISAHLAAEALQAAGNASVRLLAARAPPSLH